MKVVWQVLVLIILVFAFIQPSFAADPPLPTPVGRVIWVKGIFKAVGENKEERTLQKMSVIYLHDTLLTDSQTTAQIAFTDQSLMTFRADTKFLVDQYSFDQKKVKESKGSVGKYIMKLIKGGFRTVTGLIAKGNPSDYQINTPVATIGVRGTDYTAVVSDNGQLAVGFYSGAPFVKNDAGITYLTADQPYASVPTATTAPIISTTRPAELGEDLPIEQAKIDQFNEPGGTSEGGTSGTGGTGGAGGGSTTTGGGGVGGAVGGTISSFCIS